MRFDMLSVWSQWLLASQALLEHAWEKDGLTRFGDRHDHDTQDDHDDHDTWDDHDVHDNLARMPRRSLKRVKNELIHSQSDVDSLLFLLHDLSAGVILDHPSFFLY